MFSTKFKVLQEYSHRVQSSCQSSLWAPIQSSLIFVTLDDTKKNGPKTLVTVKTAKLWNLCSYRPLTSRRNDHIICTITFKKPCGRLKFLLWLFFCSMKREEKGQKLFFNGRIAFFFSKFWVFNNHLDTKKTFTSSRVVVKKSLWTPISCSLIFATSDNTKKNGPKTYVIVKTALFWKVCFYRPIRSPRHVLVICTIVFKTPCGPFLILPSLF